MTDRANPFSIDPNAIATLARALRDAGYTGPNVSTLGHIGTPGWIPRVRDLLANAPPPFAALVRLFILNDPVPRNDLDDALTPPITASLSSLGLATPQDLSLRATVTLVPNGNLFIACDIITDQVGLSLPDDFVLGAGNASHILADLTIRRPTALAVDLGCGQGFHSILASRHASRLVGSDINPRALAFARLNAALNNVTADFRLGSLFEPLADLKGSIGLLTCNPPFVIAPSGATTSLHASLEADTLVERIIRDTPAFLADDTFATILAHWHHPDPKDFAARPREWLAPSGCDALLLHFQSLSPDAYFHDWIEGTTPDPAASRAAWNDLRARHSIAAVSFGAFVLRKRSTSGPRWIRAQHVTVAPRNGPASDQLLRLFTNQDRLASFAMPAQILDSRWRAVPARRFLTPPPGQQGNPALVHTQGLFLPVHCDENVAKSLDAFDGSRSTRAVLQDLHRRGLAPFEPAHPQSLNVVATLAAMGFLERAD